MKYQYDYDVKDDLMELLEEKADFLGESVLAHYMEIYHNEKNPSMRNLLKFCIYRLSANLTDIELRSFDCDVSRGVIEAFPQTYSWLKDSVIEHQTDKNRNDIPTKYQLRINDTIFRGDTMTSIWTTLKDYVKLKTGTYKLNSDDSWELFVLQNYKKIDLSYHAGQFIQLGHSIGNFIPVPPGFNVGRSNFGRWDYWDLTLFQIHQWYVDNQKESHYINNHALEVLFSNDKNKQFSIINCQKWLESFGTWQRFIQKNYMESFVDKNGKPKKFFKRHSLEYPLPKTTGEFEEFFKTVNECIADRGKAIINRLIENDFVSEGETKSNSRSTFLERIKFFIRCTRPSIYLRSLLYDLKEDTIWHLGRATSILSLILASSYAFIILMIYIFSGNYLDQFGLLKRFKFSELVEFKFSMSGNYFNDISIGIFLAILAFALFGICIKGIYQRTGFKKKFLKMIAITGWVGAVICIIGYSAVHWFLHSEMGWSWSGKVGYVKATNYFNVILLFGSILSLVIAILWLLSIVLNCFLKSTRKDILQWFLTLLMICYGIPIVLFLLENIITLIGALCVWKICSIFGSSVANDESKIKVFDSHGNYVGTIDKNSDNLK